MLTQQQINHVISEISLLDTEGVNDVLLAIVDVIAQKLEATYAEICFVNSSRTLARPRAGSGEVGRILAGHDRAWYLKVHNEYIEQVGPVIVLGEVRIVDWKSGEITAYHLPSRSSNFSSESPVVVANSPPFWGSPEVGSRQEIYLPIRSGNNRVGALALYFDDPIISSSEEIYLLQTIADFIGNFANFKDYQTD